MLDFLKVLTVVLVAVAMAMSLAHALELPGKMRLSKEVYLRAQRIYYFRLYYRYREIHIGEHDKAAQAPAIAQPLARPLFTADFHLGSRGDF